MCTGKSRPILIGSFGYMLYIPIQHAIQCIEGIRTGHL